ncbi:TIGR00730 family Rossman fold protein [uncultured Chitinophaga sp.]|uniref:LOG family protein n=1 Tax=uncultured Chitinophaga sp. TaxID=339340 RepID=UPI0025E40742|nr:TIGR00730 family Rossman fold protein [uncultured Chitinophaga sp.]
MKSVTVFCASSPGENRAYMEAAFETGQVLAEKGMGLVYGGARVGLMGAVADGALSAGGKVIGVLPDFLRSKEIAHTGLTELIVVDSMHARKTKMNDLCDGIIALPGGFGTLEELFEILTWGQLGLHKKPVGLLNVRGFYDSLIALLDHMTAEQLLKKENRDMLLVSDNVHTLLELMDAYVPPVTGKWITKDEV